jgi:hypothetical protein
MTKISNQYSLTNILTADLANSRLGINNVSPTVALDVTGAGKFSGALTVTGGIIASAANGNIRIKGSTDGFLGAGESDNKLYLTDWTTAAKGLIINLTNGSSAFSSDVVLPYSKALAFNSISNQYITADATNLYLGTANLSRLVINTSGYVGVNTTSPATFLHVVGPNTSNRGQLCIQSNDTNNAAAITFYYSTTKVGNIGSSSSDIGIESVNATGFYTGGGERMRIAGSGDIMFKDTSGNNVVYFTAANPSLSFSYAVLNRTASSPMYWNSGTGQIGLNTSARRFKKDIVSITPEQTKIALLLNPVEYTRIETNEKEFGFIAEEVRDAGLGCFVPEIDGEALTIDYSKLSVFAIAMIKEQQKAIQELSAENTSLINRIEALENK